MVNNGWSRNSSGCLSHINASGKTLLDSAEAPLVKFAIWIIICTSVRDTRDSDFSIVALSLDDDTMDNIANHNRFSHLSYGRPINSLKYEAAIVDNQLRLFGTAFEMVNYKVYRFWSNLSYNDILDNEDCSTPSKVLQILTGTVNAFSGNKQILITATPNITSGTQVWSRPITINKGTGVRIDMHFFGDHSTGSRSLVAAFFRNSTLVGVTNSPIASSGEVGCMSYISYDQQLLSGTTYTYSCRIGATGSGTWYFNQDKNGNKWGGTFLNMYSLTEIA